MEIRPLLQDAIRTFAKGILKGTECPCCGRYAKINKISVTKGMALSLAWIVRESHPAVDNGWVYVQQEAPNWLLRSNSHAKLMHWGLIERKENTNTKTKCSGVYKPTSDGRAFMTGTFRIKKTVLVYDGKVMGHEGDFVNLIDCIGEPFDYDKMVRRAA